MFINTNSLFIIFDTFFRQFGIFQITSYFKLSVQSLIVESEGLELKR